MKRFSFHAYTRAGYPFLWLGTPVVFAIAAALLFTLLYFLFPTMHVNGLTAVFIALGGLAIALGYHVLMRRRMYHAYETEINKDEMIVYKDGKEISLGRVVYAAMAESETDRYRKAVFYAIGQKRLLVTAYSGRTFYGLGCREDVEEMESAYFALKKYLPDVKTIQKKKKEK